MVYRLTLNCQRVLQPRDTNEHSDTPVRRWDTYRTIEVVQLGDLQKLSFSGLPILELANYKKGVTNMQLPNGSRSRTTCPDRWSYSVSLVPCQRISLYTPLTKW